MRAHGFVDVLVEESDECAGCAMRWKAESEPRVVKTLRYSPESGEMIACEVTGMGADGPCPALAVTVEDSGGGTAVLVWGGDLGLRLHPLAGGATIGEPYLLLSPEDVD